jgi:hypothetical protein
MQPGPTPYTVYDSITDVVVVRCPVCAQMNRVQRVRLPGELCCGACRTRLADPFAPSPVRRPAITWRAVLIAGAAALAVIFGVFVIHAVNLKNLERSLRSNFATREMAIHAQEAASEAEFRRVFSDTDLFSGARARWAHDDEWNRRLAHEKEFARTPLERVIQEMDRVAENANYTPEQVLEKVALLSAPKGSEVRIGSVDDKFTVHVAFKMSATSQGESGAVTKHHSSDSLRREMVEISSRVIRDLYDHCGRKGIGEIRVSCNHAVRRALVPAGASDAEKRRLFASAPVTWSVLYRASIPEAKATAVSNWRKLPLHKVADLLASEDTLQTLFIDSGLRSLQMGDPEGRLEY